MERAYDVVIKMRVLSSYGPEEVQQSIHDEFYGSDFDDGECAWREDTSTGPGMEVAVTHAES